MLCSIGAFMFCIWNATAQDTILRADGTTILCKIVSQSSMQVKYKKWTNLQGPTYVVAMSDIVDINGKLDKDNELIGIWQMVQLQGDRLIVQPSGKIFLSGGRVLGYKLVPTDYNSVDTFDFDVMYVGTYHITGQNRYEETLMPSETSAQNQTFMYDYSQKGKRMMRTSFTNGPNGGVATNMVQYMIRFTDDKELMNVLVDRVSRNYDTYVKNKH